MALLASLRSPLAIMPRVARPGGLGGHESSLDIVWWGARGVVGRAGCVEGLGLDKPVTARGGNIGAEQLHFKDGRSKRRWSALPAVTD